MEAERQRDIHGVYHGGDPNEPIKESSISAPGAESKPVFQGFDALFDSLLTKSDKATDMALRNACRGVYKHLEKKYPPQECDHILGEFLETFTDTRFKIEERGGYDYPAMTSSTVQGISSSPNPPASRPLKFSEDLFARDVQFLTVHGGVVNLSLKELGITNSPAMDLASQGAAGDEEVIIKRIILRMKENELRDLIDPSEYREMASHLRVRKKLSQLTMDKFFQGVSLTDEGSNVQTRGTSEYLPWISLVDSPDPSESEAQKQNIFDGMTYDHDFHLSLQLQVITNKVVLDGKDVELILHGFSSKYNWYIFMYPVIAIGLALALPSLEGGDSSYKTHFKKTIRFSYSGAPPRMDTLEYDFSREFVFKFDEDEHRLIIKVEVEPSIFPGHPWRDLFNKASFDHLRLLSPCCTQVNDEIYFSH